MNAKHLFLTLTMLLASLTFAWGGTNTDALTASGFATTYGLTKTTTKDFSSLALTSTARYGGQIRYHKSGYLILSDSYEARIASTTSGGLITTVSVVWNGDNADCAVMVYASNTAFDGSEQSGDLSSGAKSCVHVGDITYPATSLDVAAVAAAAGIDGYRYVALVGDGDLYLTSMSFVWTEETTYKVTMDALYDSDYGEIIINGNTATAGDDIVSAKAGDLITIEITPEADYCLTGFTFGDMEFDLSCMGYLEEEETGTFKILMPESNVTLTAEFDDMPRKKSQAVTIKEEGAAVISSTILSGLEKTFTFELRYNGTTDPVYDGTVTVTAEDGDVFAVTSSSVDVAAGTGSFTIKGFTGSSRVVISTSKSIYVSQKTSYLNITVSPREVALVAEGSDGKFYAMANTVTDGTASAKKVIKSGDYYYYDPSDFTLSDFTWNVMTTSVDDDAFSIQNPTTSNYLRLPKSKLLLEASDYEWWKDENDFFVSPSNWGPNYGGSNFAAASSPSYGVVEVVIGANFLPYATYSTNTSTADVYDSRSLTEGGYGTFCSPYDVPDVSTAGAKFYSLTGKVLNGDKTQLAGIVLSEDPETELVAGHSYFYQVDAGSSAINLTGCMNHVTHAWENGADGFVGCLVDDNGGKTYVPNGVERINGNYILQSGKLRYVAAGTTASIRAYRAYINVGELEDVDAKSVPKRRIVRAEGFEGELGMEDTATGIDELAENSVINWNEPVYNIMGMRVGKGATGVLIQNGHKFFVK